MAIGQYSEKITYDGPRGNITSIQRYGVNSPQNLTNLQSGLIDNLTMTYVPGTNKLQSVIDNGQPEFKHLGFAQASGSGATANVYDASGNITYDHTKYASITYNHLNLPSIINLPNGNKIENQYSASGTKLKTIRSTNTTVIETQHYVGGIEYKQQPNNTTNYRLEAIYHPEGRVYNTNITDLNNAAINLRYEYCIKDHLGNTRLTFHDRPSGQGGTVGQIEVPAEILQENHYYPFGERACSSHTKWLVGEVKRSIRPASRFKNERGANSAVWKLCAIAKVLQRQNMGGPWMNDATATDKPYQYNGKELESFGNLSWLAFGARWYDPAIGRFTGVDPLADKFAHVNTYNYAENEPVANIDLWGLQKVSAKLNLKQGTYGVDFRVVGSKTGVVAYLGGRNFFGFEGSINFSKLKREGKMNINEKSNEVGISGGKVFGGKVSATYDEKTKTRTNEVRVDGGLVNHKIITTTDKEGEKKMTESTGVSLGAEIGIGIIGVEAEISIDIEADDSKKPLGIKIEGIQQDNTKTEIIIPPKTKNEPKVIIQQGKIL